MQHPSEKKKRRKGIEFHGHIFRYGQVRSPSRIPRWFGFSLPLSPRSVSLLTEAFNEFISCGHRMCRWWGWGWGSIRFLVPFPDSRHFRRTQHSVSLLGSIVDSNSCMFPSPSLSLPSPFRLYYHLMCSIQSNVNGFLYIVSFLEIRPSSGGSTPSSRQCLQTLVNCYRRVSKIFQCNGSNCEGL